jgi:glycosyltransferase involved in cell wall biosynthesis
VLICRQPRAALIALTARAGFQSRDRAPRVVLDLRGLRDVEYLLTLDRDERALSSDESARLRVYREQERDAVNGADGVVCVSSPMAQILGERYGTDRSRIAVIANHARPVPYAEDLRGAARGELGITGGELLITYCGTLAAWQMAEESALLVRSLRARRPDARLLYLTPDATGAQAIVERLGLERTLVRSAPQEEVPRLLCAADYGLLLRQASPVNRVACPVKWGEYLACGVRPILTPHIGDQSALALEHDLGVVVPPDDVDAAAQRVALDLDAGVRLTREGRERRRAFASTHLAPERAAEQVAAFADGLD